ncbi:hypothetical protein F8388_025250 [Cannabis sativa]|uniref:Uncharacterized protein n=1 Tax=Cannabis sativa TaxID=3483 RepID=A0A7J6FS62_CANSA|nr:hypothetical protein F8388_025250 [Cannabis sativa]
MIGQVTTLDVAIQTYINVNDVPILPLTTVQFIIFFNLSFSHFNF